MFENVSRNHNFKNKDPDRFPVGGLIAEWRYETPVKRMVRYVRASRDLIANFESFKIIQVLREEISHVDTLANLGLSSRIVMRRMISFMYLKESSIEALKLTKVVNIKGANEDW